MGICHLKGYCQSSIQRYQFPFPPAVCECPVFTPTLCWIKGFDLCQSDMWKQYLCVVVTGISFIMSQVGHLFTQGPFVFFFLWTIIHIFCSFLCFVMSVTFVELFISWEGESLVTQVIQIISQVVIHLLIFLVVSFGQSIVRRWMKEKASALGSGKREKTEQIPKRDVLCWLRQEGRKVRVKGPLVETGGRGSNAPGVVHSDWQVWGRKVPWQMWRCLSKKWLPRCKAVVSSQPTAVDSCYIHPAFRTSLRPSWGWPWQMTEQGGGTRAEAFPRFPLTLGSSSAPWWAGRDCQVHTAVWKLQSCFLSLLSQVFSPLPHFTP